MFALDTQLSLSLSSLSLSSLILCPRVFVFALAPTGITLW